MFVNARRLLARRKEVMGHAKHLESGLMDSLRRKHLGE